MKTTLSFLLIIIVFITFVTSCTMEKKLYSPGYYVEWKKNKTTPDLNNLEKKQISSINNNKNNINNFDIPADNFSENKLTASIDPSDLPTENNHTNNFYSNPTFKYLTTDSCDVIILRSGEIINATSIEIEAKEVKFKKCDNKDGPTISVKSVDIYMIKHADGTKDLFTASNNSSNDYSTLVGNNSNEEKKPEEKKGGGFGIVSFVSSIVGLIVAAVIFGPLAIVFGFLGIDKKNKGLAIAGLIIGVIDLMVGIIIMATLL